MSQQCRRVIDLLAPLAFVFVLVVSPGSTLAESGTRERSSQPRSAAGAAPRIYAEPIFARSDPYLLGSQLHRKFPVAANGYSVVALRDQKKWLAGQAVIQAIFDGQLYWFANQREKEIFAAAPDKYAPVLGGDCLVTFAETTERVPGDMRFGVVHRGRVYFFASSQLQERFKNNTEQYVKADLAHGGNCVVCKVEQQKQIQGLPGTVAVVDGQRFYFAGSHQRAIFGANPGRYGIKAGDLFQYIDVAVAPGKTSSQLLTPGGSGVNQPEMTSAENTDNQQPLADDKQLPEETVEKKPERKPTIEESIPEGKLAMEGYCPISIREQGIWVRGSLDFQVEIDEKIYLLAGEAQKETFQKTPETYLPVLSGNCLVTLVDKEKHVAGSVFYSSFDPDNDRIYLFVGAKEKRAFKANRRAYLEAAKIDLTPAQ